jgi:hypothetical protein
VVTWAFRIETTGVNLEEVETRRNEVEEEARARRARFAEL